MNRVYIYIYHMNFTQLAALCWTLLPMSDMLAL